MVNWLNLAENAYIGARKWVKPSSFEGLRYSPLKTLERDIVDITPKTNIVGVPLDKTSEECKYFGVDSYEHIAEKILNHDKLYKAKEHWCFNWDTGQILNISVSISKRGIKKFKDFFTETLQTRQCAWSRFREFNSQHAARMTCYSEIFGKDPYGYPAPHTIGLVSNNGNLYILDSLGEQVPQIKEFHAILNEVFKDFGYKKIIFSTKPQQPMTEFTCNNWTYANIETTLKAIFEKRMNIESAEELNKILPEDINKILKEQHNAAIWVD